MVVRQSVRQGFLIFIIYEIKFLTSGFRFFTEKDVAEKSEKSDKSQLTLFLKKSF